MSQWADRIRNHAVWQQLAILGPATDQAEAPIGLTGGVHSLIFLLNAIEGDLGMPKTLTMRLDEETYDVFIRAARAERRSLANFIETAALKQVQESTFADDAEMAEILARPELVERLKAGSRDARKRKGRFV